MAGNRKAYEEAMRQAYDKTWDNNWRGAIEAYKRALMEFPDDTNAIMGLGTAFLELGQEKIALQVFERASLIDPQNPDAHSKLADVKERLGMLEEAAASHLQAGDVLAMQNEIDLAVDSWKKVTVLSSDVTNRNKAEAHRKLAQAHVRLGRTAQAVSEYLELVTIYHRQRQIDQARAICREALSLDENNPDALAMMEALQEGKPLPKPSRGAQKVATSPGQVEEEDLFFMEDLTFDDLLEEEMEEKPEAESPVQVARKMAMEELASVLFEDSEDEDTGSTDLAQLTGGREPSQTRLSKAQRDALIVQAIDHQTQGLTDMAIEGYRRAIEGGLSKAAAFFNLGLLHQEGRDYAEAVKYLGRVLTDERYRMAAHFAIGECYRAEGKINQALPHFIDVLKVIDLQAAQSEQAEDLIQLYQSLADTYITQGNTEKTQNFISALVGFLTSKGWEDKVADARRKMDGLAEEGQVMSLAEFLETPETEVILSAMAVTQEYIKENILMTAAEECLMAIDRAPYYLPLHVRLGEILLKQERIEDAISKFLTVANVYYIRGLTSQAVDTYNRILRLAPMDVEVRSRLVELLKVEGKYEQVLEEYMTLADSYYQLAQVGRALEKYQEALEIASRAARGQVVIFQSSDEKAWRINIQHRIGDIHVQRFDWVNATRAYEDIILLAPDDKKALFALADLYLKQLREVDAMRILDKLVEVYFRGGQQDKALDTVKELLDRRPESLALKSRLARTYADAGMVDDAVAEYDALAEMQMEEGSVTEAAKTIKRIIDLNPPNVADYRRFLAEIDKH